MDLESLVDQVRLNTLCEQARRNLEALARNPYPGRGIVVGLDRTGTFLVQAYWLMGRSEGSRNRVLVDNGSNRISTDIADPSREQGDPKLLIYDAMDELDMRFIVSNGNQTETIMMALRQGSSFHTALRHREYEPDGPNFTPRISAISSLHKGEPMVEFSILHKAPESGACHRSFFDIPRLAGIGYCITTYTGDGKPLPAFHGEPYPLPFDGPKELVPALLWNALNKENRVALAAKFVNVRTRTTFSVKLINTRAKVAD